jgi:hypothetical protein
MGTRGCGARRTTSDACATLGRRGGKRPAPPGLWGDGARRALPRRRGRLKQQRRRRRGRARPREAHAAAHLWIVPVDVPSTLDQPPELRLVAVVCGLIQFLVLRGTEPARHLRGVSGARGSADEFPDTQSERNRQTPESPKVRSMPCSARALRGKRPGCRVGRKGQRARPMRAMGAPRGRFEANGRAAELAVRASAHAR